jgi:hypothetical protein
LRGPTLEALKHAHFFSLPYQLYQSYQNVSRETFVFGQKPYKARYFGSLWLTGIGQEIGIFGGLFFG